MNPPTFPRYVLQSFAVLDRVPAARCSLTRSPRWVRCDAIHKPLKTKQHKRFAPGQVYKGSHDIANRRVL
jgi:hypothetical protein